MSNAPRLFLTDYASYNNGMQFEFGHWVDLDQFSDAEEFGEYITEHFRQADKKSPLPCGSIREEVMFTDFENFPRELYTESGGDLENLFEYLNMEEEDRVKVQAIMAVHGYDIQYAIEHAEDVYMREYDPYSNNDKYDLFAEYFPEADQADDNCSYLSIDYDSFINDFFHQVEIEGTTYLIDVE